MYFVDRSKIALGAKDRVSPLVEAKLAGIFGSSMWLTLFPIRFSSSPRIRLAGGR